MEAAVEPCRHELAAQPDSGQLIRLSARVEFAEGDPAVSAELWQQLLDREGWSDPAARGRAMALWRAGEIPAAEALLRQRVEREPSPGPRETWSTSSSASTDSRMRPGSRPRRPPTSPRTACSSRTRRWPRPGSATTPGGGADRQGGGRRLLPLPVDHPRRARQPGRPAGLPGAARAVPAGGGACQARRRRVRAAAAPAPYRVHTGRRRR